MINFTGPMTLTVLILTTLAVGEEEATLDPTDPGAVATPQEPKTVGEGLLAGPDVQSDSSAEGRGGKQSDFGMMGSGVQGLLAAKCGSCHGAEKQKGGVRVVPVSSMFQGDQRDWVVIPGQPDQSSLLQRVMLPAGHDDIMPPKGPPLSAQDIQVLRDWIAGGKDQQRLIATASMSKGQVDPRTWTAVYLSLDLNDAQREAAMKSIAEIQAMRQRVRGGNGPRGRDSKPPQTQSPGMPDADPMGVAEGEADAATPSRQTAWRDLKAQIEAAQRTLWAALDEAQQHAMRSILADPAKVEEARRDARQRMRAKGRQPRS